MNQNSFSSQVILNVNTTEDQNDGSEVGGLSLRDAFIRANSDPTKQYIINLPSGDYDLTLTEDGSIDIRSTISLVGAGAGDTIISGSFLGDRIFDVTGIGNFTVANVTIQNANVGTESSIDVDGISQNTPVNGGAININPGGKATLKNTIIAQNRTNGNGGGIANAGFLQVEDSAILVNTTVGSGGGVFNTGTALINRSSIAFNTSGNLQSEAATLGGGGIFNDGDGEITILNSTISNNTGLIGGGIWNQGVRGNIVNSTIARNRGSLGAGITSTAANTVVRNSIVAENINDNDVRGEFDAQTSFNLIGVATGGTLVNGIRNNQVGTPEQPIITGLGDLPQQFQATDGASAILVHSLQPGSPAINAGNNSSTNIRDLFNFFGTTDQRGQPRIINGTVDLGSFEFSQNQGVGSDNFSSGLTNPLFRFHNTQASGTYLFANNQEAQAIRNNFPNFQQEGIAFNVGVTPGDDLIPIYRFQNRLQTGTYLYVGEGERQNIIRNFANTFSEEGLAFYVYGADSNRGEDIFRFQSLSNPSTYIFVKEAEKNNIMANLSNQFAFEGVAFEV